MTPADDARLTRMEGALAKQGEMLVRLDTFVREDVKRSRSRLKELEDTVNCPESGLVLKVDRIEGWKRRHARLAWLILTLGLGTIFERFFLR